MRARSKDEFFDRIESILFAAFSELSLGFRGVHDLLGRCTVFGPDFLICSSRKSSRAARLFLEAVDVVPLHEVHGLCA